MPGRGATLPTGEAGRRGSPLARPSVAGSHDLGVQPIPPRPCLATSVAAVVAVVAVAAVAVLAAPAPGLAAARGSGPTLLTPLDGEASFGEVVARAPAGARDAVLVVGGRWAGRVHLVGDGEARFTVRGRVGPQSVTVRFVAGAQVLGAVTAHRVWLLPRSGAVARAATFRDEALSGRLATLGRAFSGWAGVYVQDLSSGSYASWNADASFLAASTVKLGVMIEALGRYGPFPERSAVWGDISAMISLSSNDAANRVFLRLGDGSESRAAALLLARFQAIGATATTFPGTYRLTQAAALDAPAPPPLLTWRRSTARDLGRIVSAVHAAALGNADALRRTGLTVHEARLGLALLLAARPEGGPLLGAVKAGLPVAQKTGWTDKARHVVAIVYAPGGPKLLAVMTYRPGIDAAAAARLARGVTAALGVGSDR